MRSILAIFLIFQVLLVKSQSTDNCDLNERLRVRTPDSLKIEQISLSEYEASSDTKEVVFKSVTNSDSVETLLIEKYNFIERTKNGIAISCKNEQFNLVKLSGEDSKGNKTYKIKFLYQDKYVVFYESGYESWAYYLIDLKNSKGYSLPTKPRVIENKFIFGSSSYYGDQDFKIYSLNNEKKFSFTINSTRIRDYHFENNKLRFKVTDPCKENDFKRFGYYEIKILNNL